MAMLSRCRYVTLKTCSHRNFFPRVRCYSKSQEGDAADKTEQDENSALVQRFTQILESRVDNSGSSSLVDRDEDLKKVYDTHYSESGKQRAYDLKYQKELGLLKSERLLLGTKGAKSAADLAGRQPWDGNETPLETSRRMLEDSTPKLKVPKRKTPPPAPHVRVADAREASIDYKMGKPKDDGFREMYKERLLGPSMLLGPSLQMPLNFTSMVADAKINSNIDHSTGQFRDKEDMSKVRGKPLDREHLANCTDTNYYMTQILNRQEVLPPWIESQQGIDREINSFRHFLDGEWLKWLLNRIKGEASSRDAFLAAATKIKRSPESCYDKEFCTKQSRYVNEKVKLLNSQIRDYNLQSPSNAVHKLKLVPENEFKNLYRRVLTNLEESVVSWYDKEEEARNTPVTTSYMRGSSSFIGLFDGGPGGGGNQGERKPVFYERKPEKIHFWKSLKSLFQH